MEQARREDLEKQGYRIIGNHSAVKTCMWTRQAIRGNDVCYKNTFYGINSHRCIQMTPALPFCTHRCIFCWRDIEWTKAEWEGEIDEPKKILDMCIYEHLNLLQGFRGSKNKDEKNFEESQNPKHVAISLSGEPTLYPKLPELIKEIKKRKMTSFLVTNGTNPGMLKKLIKLKIFPTQFYITLPAPNKEIYEKVCNPLIKNGWEKVNESLNLLKKFKRSTIRMTLVKGLNLLNEEGYSNLIKKANPEFLELKAYMWVGYSRKRLSIKNMPLHSDIKKFAENISKLTKYKIIDEKPNSRVVLLMRKDADRRVKF